MTFLKLRAVFAATVLIFLFSTSVKGQIDTEFWFAPPEVTSGHGDSPLSLKISTLNEAAQVKITQPARNNALIASFSIGANTTRTVNLTNYLNQLETDEGAVRNTGIKITATKPITAYYEVNGSLNADIFTLKGKNALGNKFIIPAQNLYNNGANYNPLPYASFDIVATKNNTVVNIRPANPVYGHESDSVITIKLNAGETYSLRNVTQNALINLGGSEVISNKPIAITIKDDSVRNGNCYDLLGDQLIPVKVAGIEYIVLEGFLFTEENLFITATEDNTSIYINGSSDPVTTLDKGELFRYTIKDRSTYILSSKPIYVFHTTGFGCELGMAILPSINCKGSLQVGFTRSTSDFFGLNILVRKDGIDKFKLNNRTDLVTASDFNPVPGSNEKWYTAQLDFNTNQIGVGQANQLVNSSYSFQLGLVNGNENTTCRYGYFSAFSTLFIGDDIDMCIGDTQTLDAGAGKENYLWNTGDTTQQITVDTSGIYWVRAEKEQCILYDTIKIATKKGSLNLGPDVNICPGEVAQVDGKRNFSWNWSNGTNTRYLATSEPGKYWLDIKDYTGCEASDTVNIIQREAPEVNLGPDIIKCPKERVELDVSLDGADYLWSDSTNQPNIMLLDSGVYWVDVTKNGCTTRDSITIKNLLGPEQDTIYGSPSVCPLVKGVDYSTFHTEGASYFWKIDGGEIKDQNGNVITVDWGTENANAEVKLVVEEANGCLSDTIRFPVRINVQLEVQRPKGSDTLCFNNADNQLYSVINTNGSTYQWSIEGGELVSGQGTHEVLVNWNREGNNQLEVTEESTTLDTVCVGTSEIKEVLVFKDTAEIQLKYVTNDTVSDETIHVKWITANNNRIGNDTVTLYRMLDGGSWEQYAQFPSSEDNFTDNVSLSGMPVAYQLSAFNKCNELLETSIHKSILLTGKSDTLNDEIELNWTAYEGWTNGVKNYQLWRKLDDDEGYKFFRELESDQLSFLDTLGSDGFHHTYIIRALSFDGAYDSWSNSIEFEFSHPVIIPNVITPNGDSKNDFFTIKKIHLYKDNDLTIYNRNGKTVYQKRGYNNRWNGEKLSGGIYYYYLNLNKNNLKYRGFLHILK